jgi:threonine/homoserine/homoserine lactone efflux protein
VTDAAALLARMFVIGIAVAAPVGAMGVLCIQRTLSHGWRAGATTGAGIATADALYAALAAFGLTVFSQLLVSAQIPLRIGGGLVLVWLGWRAFSAKPAHEAARAEGSWQALSLYSSAFALTLTNPMTIMAFAAVFASAGLMVQTTAFSAGVATMGVALGSLTWWLALSTGVALMRHAVSDRTMGLVNRISGAVVVAFGLLAIWLGVASLLG